VNAVTVDRSLEASPNRYFPQADFHLTSARTSAGRDPGRRCVGHTQVARIHASAVARLRKKPSQKAIPKKSLGVRWVRRLVAKKTPTMGRTVATPRPMA